MSHKKKLQYFHIGIFNNRNILFFHLFSEVTFDCETTDGPFYPEQTPFEISNTDLPQIETETSTDTTMSQGKDGDVTRGQIITQFSDISTLWRTDSRDTRPPCTCQ